MRDHFWKESLLVQPFTMLFFPIIAFIIYTYIIYPTQPHCSLGNGFLGCVPMCQLNNEQTLVQTPCYHDEPNLLQQVLFGFQTPFYMFLAALLITLFGFSGNKFLLLISFFAGYPYFLLKKFKTKRNLLFKFLATPLFLIITAEWVVGYIFILDFLF